MNTDGTHSYGDTTGRKTSTGWEPLEPLLDGLTDSCRDPSKFWRKLQRLSGRRTGTKTYSTDSGGQRHFSDRDEVTLRIDIWRHVFQEDNDEEDNDNVLDFMRRNLHRTTPYETNTD